MLSVERKYELYESAVQNPETDIEFLLENYKKIRGKKPHTLREDFSGTGWISKEWVKLGKKYQAHCIDLDPEPVDYGKKTHYQKLNEDERTRIHYHLRDVLKATDIKTDIVFAFNFSYFIFKKREQLLKYFKSVRKSMKKNGVFFLDMFGGTECYGPIEEETDHGKFKYFWDLDFFNPITNECKYYIHFKEKGKKRYDKVFTYDWRHWGIVEVREILHEAGFKKTKIYWEGDGPDGDGDGEFYPTEKEENCESWVIYISAYN